MGSDISTHAPHTGSDLPSGSGDSTRPNFNSRSPYGERLLQVTEALTRLTFQLTLPIRGAIVNSYKDGVSLSISTHAPHTGSDTCSAVSDERHGISTHAPHTGSDPPRYATTSRSCNFNSRSPYGERSSPMSGDSATCSYFNSRSPYGERYTTTSTSPAQRDFNSRSPYGERYSWARISDVDVTFQLTLPIRGAITSLSTCGMGADFNSRSPYGER